MRVDTLIWDVLYPPHETFLERPFRPLEPLNLWIYGDPGALYPFKPSDLGALKTLHPLDPEAFGFWKRQTLERPG